MPCAGACPPPRCLGVPRLLVLTAPPLATALGLHDGHGEQSLPSGTLATSSIETIKVTPGASHTSMVYRCWRTPCALGAAAAFLTTHPSGGHPTVVWHGVRRRADQPTGLVEHDCPMSRVPSLLTLLGAVVLSLSLVGPRVAGAAAELAVGGARADITPP